MRRLLQIEMPNTSIRALHDSTIAAIRTPNTAMDSREIASMTGANDKVVPSPDTPWFLRYECPSIKPVTLVNDNGLVGVIAGEMRALEGNVGVQRCGAFLEFIGMPSRDVSIVLNYGEHLVRLRLCAEKVVLAEYLQMDNSAVSKIELNLEELVRTPAHEIAFDARFTSVRVRFNENRAILSLENGEFRLQQLQHK